MHTTNLRKVGGSVMLAVPPALLDMLHLGPGTEVGLAVESGRLVIEPRRRPRYTLQQLLAQSKLRRRSRRERQWLTEKPAGRELL